MFLIKIRVVCWLMTQWNSGQCKHLLGTKIANYDTKYIALKKKINNINYVTTC